MLLARRIGAAVLALAAVVIWFVMAPDASRDTSGDVGRALADYEANEARTQGAPQQQVLTGWVARDLLPTTAARRAGAASTERLPPLAGLVVLGLPLPLAPPPRPFPPATPPTAAPAPEPAAVP